MAIVLLSSLLCVSTAECAAPETSDNPTLFEQIIDKEVELARLNTSLKLSSLPNGWYLRRWQGAQITNNVMTSSGAFLNAITSLHYQEHPAKLNRYLLANAALVRALANFISTSECTVEFGLDATQYIAEKGKGQDLKSIRNRAYRLIEDIDYLLVAAHENGASLYAPAAACYATEERALRDIRTAESADFVFLYAQAKQLKTKKHVNQLLCFTANLESGICTVIGISGLLTRQGSPVWRSRLASTAGFGDIVGGTMMAAMPIASRLAGRVSRNKNANTASDTIGTVGDVASTSVREDCNALTELVGKTAQQDKDLELVWKFSQVESKILVERKDLFRLEDHIAKVALAKSLLASQTGSWTKVTNGIGTVIGDLTFTHPTRGRLQIFGGTAMGYGCGNAIAACVNIERHLSEEARSSRLSHQMKSPRQILEAHIDELTGLGLRKYERKPK